MRVVVDTNIAFSAILNTNSKIASLILQPKSKLNFYSTNHLLEELSEHKQKLKQLSGYSESDFQRAKTLIVNRIKFINVSLIPLHVYQKSLLLTQNVDIDDTEFVALAEHIKGKLWTGDKVLSIGLKKKKWERLITTNELVDLIINKTK